MFPGYLFAKFVYSEKHRAVKNSQGVRGIVHFGDRLATLPENIVVGLQSRVGAEEVVTVDSLPQSRPIGSNYRRAFSETGGRG
jgi:transcription antitermination factor NusG